MTTVQDSQCAIWPEYSAQTWQETVREDKTHYDSPRAGGRYAITEDAKEKLGHMDITVEAQQITARLTTWLVEGRRQGDKWPVVTTDVIERVATSAPIEANSRAMRLLQFLVSIQPMLGGMWQMSGEDTAMSMAFSESINIQELDFLFEHLKNSGYVDTQISGDLTMFAFGVTMDGLENANEANRVLKSAQAFAAMWFDPSVGRLYDEGIKPAIEQAGYDPYIINRDAAVNKIDDAIMAAIRESKFVVADFTHGDDGVRGSVYFEAGFAYGLGIPVIHTCREDQLKGLHFDTRQYNHIDWAEPKDVIERLRDAILARVGRGPIKTSHDGD